MRSRSSWGRYFQSGRCAHLRERRSSRDDPPRHPPPISGCDGALRPVYSSAHLQSALPFGAGEWPPSQRGVVGVGRRSLSQQGEGSRRPKVEEAVAACGGSRRAGRSGRSGRAGGSRRGGRRVPAAGSCSLPLPPPSNIRAPPLPPRQLRTNLIADANTPGAPARCNAGGRPRPSRGSAPS